MTLHSILEFIKYNWKAKGRHGTHSPFVYDLVESVLQEKGPMDRKYLVACREIPLKYENLICRIRSYYKYPVLTLLPDNGPRNVPEATDIILLNNVTPSMWMILFTESRRLLSPAGAVIITDIHKTTAHTNEWNKLRNDNSVRMSVDLYGLGMLLFRPEFRHKQHFVLKY